MPIEIFVENSKFLCLFLYFELLLQQKNKINAIGN